MLKFKQQRNGMGTDIKKATTQTKIKQNGDEKPDEFEINNWWADLNVKENETFNRILRLAFDSQNSKKICEENTKAARMHTIKTEIFAHMQPMRVRWSRILQCRFIVAGRLF